MRGLGNRWGESLRGFLNRTVTIQQPTTVQDKSGQVLPDVWVDIEGMVDLPCAIGDNRLSQKHQGQKMPKLIILIMGHYSVMTNWRAVVSPLIPGGTDEVYYIDEATTGQSEDVTEIPVSRWL